MVVVCGPVGIWLVDSGLAARDLCLPCTRGCRGTVASRSHHCVRPGPSISRHLHLYPWGPFVFQGASSFQPPSLAFPFFVPPPPDSNGASPIGVASAKTNTAPTTTLRSLQGEGPAPWPTQSPDPSFSGSKQQPAYTWPSRTYRRSNVGS